jgi:hypothetical protein
MLEAYAFLAIFTVQILAFSVLFPVRLINLVQLKEAEYPEGTFEKLYPGVDRERASRRFWARYRVANLLIAAFGLGLSGWLLGNLPLLGQARAITFPVFYFLLQLSPLLFLAFTGIRKLAALRSALRERKRTAVLQRRGLFDFVSPWRVALEVSIYFLFVAFMLYLMYVAQDPIPLPVGFQMLGAVTLGFAFEAWWLYSRLYGRKVPLETRADRMRWTGLEARGSIYGTMLTVALVSLVILLPRLGLGGWLPFTLSAFFVLVALQLTRRLALAMLPAETAALRETRVS